MSFLRASVLTVLIAVPVSIVACGGDEDSKPTNGSQDDAGSGGDAAAPQCAKAPDPVKPTASCEVTLESPPVPAGAAQHVALGTVVTYCSNPPSSGDHYGSWADFQEYSTPVDWRYLVHSMEHGAVVLLYKCDAAGCPDVVEQLRGVRDRAAFDPNCTPGNKRIIIAPSTTITTKVAAAAWGKTYQAACVDLPTLEAFVRDNYAKGPEDLCIPGISSF